MKLSNAKGEYALVTGGADGIGLALARGFGRAGLRPVLADIRADGAEASALKLRQEGIEARAMGCDVSDRAATLRCAEDLAAEGIVPTVLWINAGVAAGQSLIEGKAEVVEWVFGVNVLGAIWTAQAFIPKMLDAGLPAHVGLTASSTSISAPSAPMALYATSKHGTFAIGEALRSELAEKGVGVTILCPGLLNTEIWDAARARPARFGGERRQPFEAGEYWRAAKSPDILIEPVMQTIESGGGYCIMPTQAHTQGAFEDRIAGIRAGFRQS